jgi:hypothetical protein
MKMTHLQAQDQRFTSMNDRIWFSGLARLRILWSIITNLRKSRISESYWIGESVSVKMNTIIHSIIVDDICRLIESRIGLDYPYDCIDNDWNSSQTCYWATTWRIAIVSQPSPYVMQWLLSALLLKLFHCNKKVMCPITFARVVQTTVR